MTGLNGFITNQMWCQKSQTSANQSKERYSKLTGCAEKDTECLPLRQLFSNSSSFNFSPIKKKINKKKCKPEVSYLQEMPIVPSTSLLASLSNCKSVPLPKAITTSTGK